MGFDHSCAVTTAGTAHCWGSSNFGMLGDGNVGGGSTPVTVVDP
jgi:alpha-tubulin suppressor-like RCC1 family protein